MTGPARTLLGIALVCALLGSAVIASFSQAADAAAIWAEIQDQAALAFAAGAWHWLARGTVVATALGLVFVGLEALLGLRRAPRTPDFQQLGGQSVREAVTEVRRRVLTCVEEAKPNIIAAFNELVRGAIKIQASDIHMTPSPAGFRLTYRLHGTLYDVVTVSAELAPLLSTRVKVLARLDTYVRGTPQDGRLVMSVEGGTIEARVSTLPAEGGERIVLRLVRGSRTVPDLESLGFSHEVERRLRDVLARPQGLLFVTGPVGSGKTTTLYAALKHISATRGATTSLVTLEDPIELELPFATQTQMRPRAGMTFASVLRSVLRQDPNVLMIGEIRDHETADIALQAGLTGHLILTTVHAESAVGPFARVMDLGVEPFVVASATVGCLSQRLVRTLCTACRAESRPEPMHQDRFAKHGIVLPPGPYHEAVGCDFCEGQGFTGRAPIAELLLVTPSLRQAISERKTSDELAGAAIAEGMTPLLRDGLGRALRGETTLGEVLRVTG
jgi:general secretion pathway protein E